MQNPFSEHPVRHLPEVLLAGLVLGAALLALGVQKVRRALSST